MDPGVGVVVSGSRLVLGRSSPCPPGCVGATPGSQVGSESSCYSHVLALCVFGHTCSFPRGIPGSALSSVQLSWFARQ